MSGRSLISLFIVTGPWSKLLLYLLTQMFEALKKFSHWQIMAHCFYNLSLCHPFSLAGGLRVAFDRYVICST